MGKYGIDVGKVNCMVWRAITDSSIGVGGTEPLYYMMEFL